MFLQRCWISASEGVSVHFRLPLRRFIQFLRQLRRNCISNSFCLHIFCLPLTTQVFILSWIFLLSVHVHKTPCCRQSHMTGGAWGESCPHIQSWCVATVCVCLQYKTNFELQYFPECLAMMLSAEITTCVDMEHNSRV